MRFCIELGCSWLRLKYREEEGKSRGCSGNGGSRKFFLNVINNVRCSLEVY